MAAYDASTKRAFKLQAALLWTINDFPALGNLSGMTTKGKFACPSCHTDTCYQWLVNGRKGCYMGHRRFLPTRHSWRNNTTFNGQREKRSAPKPLSGDDVLSQYKKFTQVHIHNILLCLQKKISLNRLRPMIFWVSSYS